MSKDKETQRYSPRPTYVGGLWEGLGRNKPIWSTFIADLGKGRGENVRRERASQEHRQQKQRPCDCVCEQAILAGPNYWRKKVETHYGEV